MNQREYKRLATFFFLLHLCLPSQLNSMKLLSTRLLDVNAFELKLTPIICVHFWYTYTKCQELLQKPCRRRKQCTMTGVYAVRISIQTNVCYLYFLSLVTSHFVVIVMPNTVSIANSIWKSCMDSIHTHTHPNKSMVHVAVFIRLTHCNALQCLNSNDTMKRCNFSYGNFQPFPTK